MNVHSTTPDPDALFDYAGSPDSPPGNDLEATVQRVHRATGPSSLSTDLKTHIWEDIMTTHAVSAGPGGSPSAPTLGTPLVHFPRMIPTSTWQVVTNAAMAAVLLLAIAAGLWRVSGSPGTGGNDDPESLPFAGQAIDEGSPEVAQSVDPATFPRAEDCTITPLTVDEVIWYINDPLNATRATSPEEIVMPEEVVSASPQSIPPTPFEGRHPDAEDLASVVDTFHMREACILADNHYAFWATMTPWAVGEYFELMLPPLVGEDELRASLIDLQKNGPITDTNVRSNSDGSKIEFFSFEIVVYGSTHDLIRLPDASVANAWESYEGFIAVGYDVFAPDGTEAWPTKSIFDNGMGTPISRETGETVPETSLLTGDCGTLIFVYNEARDMWLHDRGGTCG